MPSSHCSYSSFAAALVGVVFLCAPAAADTASGLPTGKRQHKPFSIRPQVARALERGDHRAALKFTLFKPDGTPVRAKVRRANPNRNATRSRARVRGWDPDEKKKVEGKSGAPGPLTCRGERACVRMIAVQKACAPRTVKCGQRSCSCRARR